MERQNEDDSEASECRIESREHEKGFGGSDVLLRGSCHPCAVVSAQVMNQCIDVIDVVHTLLVLLPIEVGQCLPRACLAHWWKANCYLGNAFRNAFST